MTVQHNTQAASAAKLENIISGHRINRDDADWLRSFALPATKDLSNSPPSAERDLVSPCGGADGQKWIDDFYTAKGYYPSLMQVWRAALAAQPTPEPVAQAASPEEQYCIEQVMK